MTGTERIRMILQGMKTDRIPYSFWTHLPTVDLDPEQLAEATYQFYKTFGLDFIKTMPNGLFSVEDFGCECDFSEIPSGGVAKITKYAVETPEDWGRLAKPDVEQGAFGRELRSLELLLAKVRGEAPVNVTVFSPLTTAQKLCGPNLIQHLRHHPEEVKPGLELIARVTSTFAKEAIRRGCAGVFYANQMATASIMNAEEYEEFGLPYDRMVLESIQDESWFNIMHIHGNDIMVELLMDLPVQAINWHIWETEPTPAKFMEAAKDKVIVGGLRRFDITEGDVEALVQQVQEMARFAEGSRLILSPGCVIRYPVQESVIHSVIGEIDRVAANASKVTAFDKNKTVYNYTYTQSVRSYAGASGWSMDTRMIHSAQRSDPATGAISQPIMPAVAYAFPDVEQAVAVVSGETEGVYYGRYGNPTTRTLEKKVAEMEGGEDALGLSSGMAAISVALLGFLQHGDHVLVTKDVYGGTYSFLSSLAPRMGISFDFVDCTDMDQVRRGLKPNTRALYIETPSNPCLTVLDIPKLGRVAKEAGIPLIVDNTFMSPYLQNPLQLGADVVVHSATKYLNGHGDVLAGVVVGSKQNIQFMRKKIMGDLGQNLNAWEAFLILRGIKTLSLRVQRHCSSAQKIAEYLETHPCIERVYYPGLASHPQHALAKRQMKGMGGIISFEVAGGISAGKQFINALELAMISFSLGDPETLVQHPATMTHASMPKEERKKFGISDGLIRLSVGLEDPDDIIGDLEQALRTVAVHSASGK